MIDRITWILTRCEEPILDVGSADGWVFRDTDLDVTYVDIDLYDLPNFIRADAHNLPLPDNSYNTVVLAEILEHVYNPIQVLREAKRVSYNKILITVPDEFHWAPEHKPFMTIEERLEEENTTIEELAKKSNPNAKELSEDLTHLWHRRYYTGAMLVEHLKLAGITNFTLEHLEYDGWAFWVVEAYAM